MTAIMIMQTNSIILRIEFSYWGSNTLKKESGSLYRCYEELRCSDSASTVGDQFSWLDCRFSSTKSSVSELSSPCLHLWQYLRESLNSYFSYLTSCSKFVTYSLCISRDLWAAYLFFYFWIFALYSLVNFNFSLSVFSSPILVLTFWMGLVFVFLLFLEECSGVDWRSWLSVSEANECESVYSFIFNFMIQRKL